MASPQIENGYTRVSNEIMEALAHIRIPGEAYQVLNVIIRKTYGFRKKDDEISLSQFCLMTGLNRPHVCMAISKLKGMNLITEKGNGIINKYSINKDFESWKPLPKKVTITEKGNLPLPKKVHTKETITKEKKSINKGRSFEVPNWIPASNWSDFEEMRKTIKKPMTLRAKELIVAKLLRLKDRGYDPAEVLNQSIVGSYQGVFEIRERGTHGDSRKRNGNAHEQPKPVSEYANLGTVCGSED